MRKFFHSGKKFLRRNSTYSWKKLTNWSDFLLPKNDLNEPLKCDLESMRNSITCYGIKFDVAQSKHNNHKLSALNIDDLNFSQIF